jgi:trigger factor
MQVSVENTGGLERRVTVQVPAERIEEEVSSRLQSMKGSIRIDGFRPGKVPLQVIEKKYGTQVRHEVIDRVIHSTLQEALTQENLRPVAEPRIEPKESLPGEVLEYAATFEIYPEPKAALDFNYQITRPDVEIGADDIAAMLEKLRKQRATWNATDRHARKDDQVVIDFEGTIDGKVFTGNKGEKMPVVLGSNSMISGFEEQLVGAAPGDELTVNVTFPADYPSAEVAGKEAQFRVKVHSVSEMVLPQLDNEFARAFGVTDRGLEGLKEEVEKNMRRELQQLVNASLKDQVFAGLLDKNPVEVPRSLIDSEAKMLQAQKNYQDLDASALENMAEKRVKLGVLVSEIVRLNQIQLDPDRVRKTVETVAASYENPEEVVQYYYGNQELLAGVQQTVMEEQVVGWVLENAGLEIVDRHTSFDAMVDSAKQSKG